VYPRKALTIMRAWALLFAFVGVQLAWNLRPFLGDKNQPFRVFGDYQGNFYTAILYAAKQLVRDERVVAPPRAARSIDSLPFARDTTPR
jgi:hypothetical protein